MELKRWDLKKLLVLIIKIMEEDEIDESLGFKYLYNFNVAITLEKKAWRLTNNHSSLLFYLLKVKYFIKSKFITIQLGGRLCYT